MTFAERLRELRTEKKMSLNDIASYIDVQRATIYKYEHGIITNIPPEKVHKLAILFGVTRPYLMGWTDDRNVNSEINLDMVAYKLRDEGPNRAKSKWKPAKADDCITAATQAMRALNKFKISRTPIYPQQIIQESAIATMVTFGDELMSYENETLPIAILSEHEINDKPHHVFRIERDAPIGRTSLTLAVELGNIYLGHSFDNMSDNAEQTAQCFAIHLLFPRPVIKLLQEHGFIFTEKTFSMVFGFCDWCIDGILNADPVSITPELNRLVKEQFVPYIETMDKLGLLHPRILEDEKELDLSRYMAGYEE